MSVQDTAKKLISILDDTPLPYDTAEKIIAEVKKGQSDTREKVMLMLVEFQTTVLQKKNEIDKLKSSSA